MGSSGNNEIASYDDDDFSFSVPITADTSTSFHTIKNSVSTNSVVMVQHTATATPRGIIIDFSSSTPNNTTSYFLKLSDSTNDKGYWYSDGSAVFGASGSIATLGATAITLAQPVTVEAASLTVESTASANILIEPSSGTDANLFFKNGTSVKWTLNNDASASDIFYLKSASANALTATQAGAVTVGPSSDPGAGTIQHTFYSRGTDAAIRISRLDDSNAGGYIGANNSKAFVLRNNGSTSELMSVTQAGAVTLGPSSGGAAGTFHVIRGNNSGTSDGAVLFWNYDTADAAPTAKFRTDSTTNSTANKIINFSRGATSQGAIGFDGGTGVQFTTFSDARLKENFLPVESQLPLIVGMAKGITYFDMKDGSAERVFGNTAQHVRKFFPSHVSEGDDGLLQVGGWGVVEYRLAKAIQELSAKNDALEARLAALERSDTEGDAK